MSMEVKHPFVSVIVPVYNTAPYLNQCMDSILGQTYGDIELICVDDGSSDESGYILDAIAQKDERVRVIHRKSPSGSGAVPRNTGLNFASGKYVMFLDSDDYFDYTMIGKMVHRAEVLHAELVMCDSFNVYEDTGEIGRDHTELHMSMLPKAEVFSYKDIPESIFQISNAAVWHRLFLRKMLFEHALCFQEGVPILDDIYFANVSLIQAKRITVIPERLIYYRRARNGGQTTQIDKYKESIFKSFSAVNKKLMDMRDFEIIKCSLQTWTISTMKWWLGCVGNYDSYHILMDLYKKEYIPGLKLLPEDLSSNLDAYWKKIIEQMLEGTFPMLCSSFLRFCVGDYTDIVLYGAGDEGRKAAAMIEADEKMNLICWADRTVRFIDGRKIFPPGEIKNNSFDVILIAINDPVVVNEVRKEFIHMGICSDQIVAVIT